MVSEILGHSSIAITGDVYGHITPDVSCGAMDVLGAAFGEWDGLLVVNEPFPVADGWLVRGDTPTAGR